jgi:hypothetical protein
MLLSQQVQLVLLVHKEQLVLLEHQDLQEPQDLLAQLVPLDRQEPQAALDHKAAQGP